MHSLHKVKWMLTGTALCLLYLQNYRVDFDEIWCYSLYMYQLGNLILIYQSNITLACTDYQQSFIEILMIVHYKDNNQMTGNVKFYFKHFFYIKYLEKGNGNELFGNGVCKFPLDRVNFRLLKNTLSFFVTLLEEILKRTCRNKNHIV